MPGANNGVRRRVRRGAVGAAEQIQLRSALRRRDREKLDALAGQNPRPGESENRNGHVVIAGHPKLILHRKGDLLPTDMGVYWRTTTGHVWEPPLPFHLQDYGGPGDVKGNNQRWVLHKTEVDAKGRPRKRVLEFGNSTSTDQRRFSRAGRAFYDHHRMEKEIMVEIPALRYFWDETHEEWVPSREAMPPKGGLPMRISWVTDGDRGTLKLWVPNPAGRFRTLYTSESDNKFRDDEDVQAMLRETLKEQLGEEMKLAGGPDVPWDEGDYQLIQYHDSDHQRFVWDESLPFEVISRELYRPAPAAADDAMYEGRMIPFGENIYFIDQVSPEAWAELEEGENCAIRQLLHVKYSRSEGVRDHWKDEERLAASFENRCGGNRQSEIRGVPNDTYLDEDNPFFCALTNSVIRRNGAVTDNMMGDLGHRSNYIIHAIDAEGGRSLDYRPENVTRHTPRISYARANGHMYMFDTPMMNRRLGQATGSAQGEVVSETRKNFRLEIRDAEGQPPTKESRGEDEAEEVVDSIPEVVYFDNTGEDLEDAHAGAGARISHQIVSPQTDLGELVEDLLREEGVVPKISVKHNGITGVSFRTRDTREAVRTTGMPPKKQQWIRVELDRSGATKRDEWDRSHIEDLCTNAEIPYRNQGLGGMAYQLFEQVVGSNPREYLTAQEKWQLLEDQGGLCGICLNPIELQTSCVWEDRAAQMDHVIPRCQGGATFQALCRPCHAGKCADECEGGLYVRMTPMASYMNDLVHKEVHSERCRQKPAIVNVVPEELRKEIEAKGILVETDGVKEYRNAVMNAPADFMQFSMVDEPRPVVGPEEVVPGYWFLDPPNTTVYPPWASMMEKKRKLHPDPLQPLITDFLPPTTRKRHQGVVLRGKGWYTHVELRWCLSRNIVGWDDVKYVIVASETIPPAKLKLVMQRLVSQCDAVDSTGSLAKSLPNALIGYRGISTSTKWRAKLTKCEYTAIRAQGTGGEGCTRSTMKGAHLVVLPVVSQDNCTYRPLSDQILGTAHVDMDQAVEITWKLGQIPLQIKVDAVIAVLLRSKKFSEAKEASRRLAALQVQGDQAGQETAVPGGVGEPGGGLPAAGVGVDHLRGPWPGGRPGM